MYPTKLLWEICDLYQPKTISTKEMIEDWKYPVFWANWIIWKYDKYNHEDKEILITCRWATCWSINISEKFSWINWNAMVAHIKNPKEVNFYFLFYFLKNLDFSKIISGSAQPQITRWWLVNVLVSLPLEESTQQKIVSKLDNLFLKIDKNISLTKQNIANIDEENNAILEKIFKECEEEFGSEKIEKNIKKVENWTPKTIWQNIFHYIDISSIDNKNFSIIETKEILWKDAPSRAKQKILKWDILFATTRPNLKNIAKIKNNYENWTASTGFCVLRANKEKLEENFLFYFLTSERVQKEIIPFIKWANYPAISDKDLKQIQIPLPSLPNQQKIVEKLDKIFSTNSELKNFYEKNLKNLEELKQSLLKQAFEVENFIQ